LAYDALLLKTKSLGNSSASAVSDRAMNLNAVKVKFSEGVTDERTARFGHDALGLTSFSKPIAGPANSVLPINAIVPNDASKFVAIPNASNKIESSANCLCVI
jgi:hypothetical protein